MNSFSYVTPEIVIVRLSFISHVLLPLIISIQGTNKRDHQVQSVNHRGIDENGCNVSTLIERVGVCPRVILTVVDGSVWRHLT